MNSLQIELHVLLRHMNVCRFDRALEQPPKAFDVIGVMLPGDVLASTVIDSEVLVAVTP